jgi:hypothetical protein
MKGDSALTLSRPSSVVVSWPGNCTAAAHEPNSHHAFAFGPHDGDTALHHDGIDHAPTPFGRHGLLLRRRRYGRGMWLAVHRLLLHRCGHAR